MSLPNFLFIGPDKTGSTWLYEILRQHPQCFVPDCKDIYFFDRYYNRGFHWYLSFFNKSPSTALAIGELSHDYLFSQEAAKRIRNHLPNVRLLTSLRNPVERTFSHYLQLVRSGLTRQSFDEALKSFPELINNSRYAKHLNIYFKLFGRNQIKVLFFDKLQTDPRSYAEEVFDFLGIGLDESIEYERRIMAAAKPRSALIARIAKIGANAARDCGFTKLVGRIKYSRLAAMLYRPYAQGEREIMKPETRKYLNETFAPDIAELEQLLGCSLKHWIS